MLVPRNRWHSVLSTVVSGVALLAAACSTPEEDSNGPSVFSAEVAVTPVQPASPITTSIPDTATASPVDLAGLNNGSATTDWWAGVQGKLSAGEHRFRLEGNRQIEAGNRANNLRARFDEHGVKLTARTADAMQGPNIRTRAVGRSEAQRLIAPAQPVLGDCDSTGRQDERGACLQRLEYPLGSGVTEWWENRGEGLEQGWTLTEAPQGQGPIVVDLEISGATLNIEAQRVQLLTAGGLSLHYHTLLAHDALGRQLPAHFAQSDSGIALTVDDRNASYPITIDPVYQSFFWTAESNQAAANFGFSVAGAGDVDDDGYSDLLVGAYLYDSGNTDEGAAFLYLGTELGPDDIAAWSAEGNQNSAYFGYSVASAGDVNGDGKSDVIVGAYLYDDGEVDEGKAFVYHGTSAGLAAGPAWSVDSDQAQASFGLSVSGAGDVDSDGFDDVIVGAPNYDSTLTDEGAVFVFLGSASFGLSTTPLWTKPSGQQGASFGQAVAGAGDVNNDGYDDVIVGAHRYQDASVGPADEGAAFVFLGSSGGPNSTAIWSAESNQTPQPDFGYAVAGAGDINNDGYDDILVGARNFENGGQTNEGRAYLYLGSSSGPALSASWTGESNLASANYGTSVSAAGDVNNDGFGDFMVGAPLATAGQSSEGRVYVYFGSAGGVQGTSFTLESDQSGAKFGMSVAGAGDINADGYDDVLIGASEFTMVQSKEGRAFVYLGSAAGLGAVLGISTTEGGQSSASYGYSVASAGDVNNDGYSDVIIGAYQYDNGQTNEGRAIAYYGSHLGLPAAASWTAEVNQATANFGQSVACAGDVNGDGFDDVIIGARLYEDNLATPDEGAAFVYHGSGGGLAESHSWMGQANQSQANFGVSVASAGDVNNDGFDDVIVGANLYNNGENDEGFAFVYKGSAGGLGLSAAWSTEGNQVSASYGASVAPAGDVNNDGFDDVIIGAPLYDQGVSNEGKAFVYRGQAAPPGLESSPIWTATGGLSGVNLGNSVAGARHLNGDNFDDVIVGAYKYNNGQTSEGRAMVFYGGSGGPDTSVSWFTESDQAGAQLGEVVASAGDVNGDGFDDVVIGASLYDNGETDEGSVFVYLGSAVGLGDLSWALDNNLPSTSLGFSAAGAGDVNADGYDDVIAGAYRFDGTGFTDQGRAYLFLGSACVGKEGIDDDGDGFRCPFDCDDSNSDVYPDAGDATCDGIDDDCNGTQDEDYVEHATTCGLGVCERSGESSCTLGVEDDGCEPGAPTAADDANCNTIDEDCSGADDEDYVPQLRHCGLGVCDSTGMSSCALGIESDNCTPGSPTAPDDTNCNTIDEDCSGEADEDYPETPTDCGVGACAATGAIDCVNGSVGDTCVTGTPAPSDPTCDGIDDDCDTFTDEEYVSELRHCGEGVCDSTGMSSCTLGIESDNCTPGSPTALDDANCNTVDEDCSGEADEDYVETPTTCGEDTVGACPAAGAISCIAGNVEDTCEPGTPAPNDETCDGIDDDCDGTNDEDAVCVDGGADAGSADAGGDAGSADAGGDAGAAAGASTGGSPAQGGNTAQGGSSGGQGGRANDPEDDAGNGGPGNGLPPSDQGDSGEAPSGNDPEDDPHGSIFDDAMPPEEPPCQCTLPGAAGQPTPTPALLLLVAALASARRRNKTATGRRVAPRS